MTLTDNSLENLSFSDLKAASDWCEKNITTTTYKMNSSSPLHRNSYIIKLRILRNIEIAINDEIYGILKELYKKE